MERKKQGMTFKLDMANAFDKVNHFFLFEIMTKFGFSANFPDGSKHVLAVHGLLHL